MSNNPFDFNNVESFLFNSNFYLRVPVCLLGGVFFVLAVEKAKQKNSQVLMGAISAVAGLLILIFPIIQIIERDLKEWFFFVNLFSGISLITFGVLGLLKSWNYLDGKGLLKLVQDNLRNLHTFVIP